MNDSSQSDSKSTRTSLEESGKAAKDTLGRAAHAAADKTSELYTAGKERVRQISDEAKAQPKPHYRAAPAQTKQGAGTTRTRGTDADRAGRASSPEDRGRTSSTGAGAEHHDRSDTTGSRRSDTGAHARKDGGEATSGERASAGRTSEYSAAGTTQLRTASHRNASASSAGRAGSTSSRSGSASTRGASTGSTRTVNRNRTGAGGTRGVTRNDRGRTGARTAQVTDALRRVPRAVYAVVAVVAVVLVVWGCSHLFTGGNDTSDDEADYDVTVEVSINNPVSTARSAWTAGEMTYLFQTDPLWTSVEYAGGTIGTTGSGPCALAMVYIYLSGATDMGPVEMCELSANNGYATEGGTSWSYMVYAAGSLGLYAEELELTYSSVRAALEAGEPVIMAVGPGDFTTGESYIVLCGIDENDMVEVHDPGSVSNSCVQWSLGTLLSQAESAWAYTY